MPPPGVAHIVFTAEGLRDGNKLSSISHWYMFSIYRVCYFFLLKYLHKSFFFNFLTAAIKNVYIKLTLSFSLNWESAMVNTKYCFKLHVNPPYIEAISPYHFTIFNEIQVIHLSLNILFLSHSPKILLFLINGEGEQSKLNCRLYVLDVIKNPVLFVPLKPYVLVASGSTPSQIKPQAHQWVLWLGPHCSQLFWGGLPH